MNHHRNYRISRRLFASTLSALLLLACQKGPTPLLAQEPPPNVEASWNCYVSCCTQVGGQWSGGSEPQSAWSLMAQGTSLDLLCLSSIQLEVGNLEALQQSNEFQKAWALCTSQCPSAGSASGKTESKADDGRQDESTSGTTDVVYTGPIAEMIAETRAELNRGWQPTVKLTLYRGNLVRVGVDDDGQAFLEDARTGARTPIDDYGEPLTTTPGSTADAAFGEAQVSPSSVSEFAISVARVAPEVVGTGLVRGSRTDPQATAAYQELRSLVSHPALNSTAESEQEVALQAEIAATTLVGMLEDLQSDLQPLLDELDRAVERTLSQTLSDTDPLLEQSTAAEKSGEADTARDRAKEWAAQWYEKVHAANERSVNEQWIRSRQVAVERIQQQVNDGQLTGQQLRRARSILGFTMRHTDDYTFGSGTVEPIIDTHIRNWDQWYVLTSEIVNNPEHGGSWGRAQAIRKRLSNPLR